jgi:N-acetylglutamate synthase-like GNAT family acetyltransferase
MRVRKAREEDLNAIYMMGFDVWGNEYTEPDYLTACGDSAKYKKGTWYILEKNALPISSLIVYVKQFSLPEKCAGIGSVATGQKYRKRGYGALLITNVLALLREQDIAAVYLFPDIAPHYYQQFGFELISGQQPYKDTQCMVLAFDNVDKLSDRIPEYF